MRWTDWFILLKIEWWVALWIDWWHCEVTLEFIAFKSNRSIIRSNRVKVRRQWISTGIWNTDFKTSLIYSFQSWISFKLAHLLNLNSWKISYWNERYWNKPNKHLEISKNYWKRNFSWPTSKIRPNICSLCSFFQGKSKLSSWKTLTTEPNRNFIELSSW